MEVTDETRWRESVRMQMELELNRRVREALESPPLGGKQKRKNSMSEQRKSPDINAHLLLEQRKRDRHVLTMKLWKSVQDRKLTDKEAMSLLHEEHESQLEYMSCGGLYQSNSDMRTTDFRGSNMSLDLTDVRFPDLKFKDRHLYTKEGFIQSLRSTNPCAGVQIVLDEDTYVDRHGITRNIHGPFWPVDWVPLFATPRFKWWTNITIEPLHNLLHYHISLSLVLEPGHETKKFNIDFLLPAFANNRIRNNDVSSADELGS